MLRFYTKEKISKEVHTINLSRAEALEILEGNLFKDCPDYNEENTVIVERDTEMAYPTWDNGELREMTREEKILILGHTERLFDGEYIENGEIKSIKAPEALIRAVWNKETLMWEESMTKEELLEKRTQKIIEYSKLEDEKKTLENSRFATIEEIQLVTDKMLAVENEINNLAEQLKIIG